jgi:hypothetical protein
MVIDPPMFCRLKNKAFSRMSISGLILVRLPLVIPLQEQPIRISPRDPYIGVGYSAIGMVHLRQSRAPMRRSSGVKRRAEPLPPSRSNISTSLSPKTRALVEATYFAGLSKAGMPEE